MNVAQLASTAEAIEPKNLRINQAVNYSGLSRSSLYRLNSEGRLVFRKAGKSVLVDFKSLKTLIDTLPEVTIPIAPVGVPALTPAPAKVAKGARTAARGRGARTRAKADA
jgi:hypothetical protein